PQATIDALTFYPLAPMVVQAGTIAIKYSSAPNAGIATPSTVTVSNGSTFNKEVTNGQWGQQALLTNVPYGAYQISVKSIGLNGATWVGLASPASVYLNSATQQTVSIGYTQSAQYGSIAASLHQANPESLSNPILQVKDVTSNLALPQQSIAWLGTTSFNNLQIGHNYQFTIDNLSGLNNMYVASFAPSSSVNVTGVTPVNLSISFPTASPIPSVAVPVNLSGLPVTQQAQLTATDNSGHAYQKSSENNSNLSWLLPTNRQYQLTAMSVSDSSGVYLPTITPGSLLIQSVAPSVVSVVYKKQVVTTEVSPYVDTTLNDITLWDNASGSLQPMGLLNLVKNSGVNSLHLAFITSAGTCAGSWGGYYPVANTPTGYGMSVLSQLKKQGVKLTVAFGGAAGTYLEQTCTSKTALVQAYQTVIQAYQPDALDFDIENAMQTNNAQLDQMMQALLIIQQQHPHLKISFTLPVMPYGLVSGGSNVLSRAKANGLSNYLVNVMAMDYGPSFTAKTMGAYAIDAANATFGQLKALYPTQSDALLWQRIGVTPMIGLNDTIPLNFTLADAAALKQFAIQKNMGLVSFWSINRDNACTVNYVSNTCSSIDPKTGKANQTTSYQYVKTLHQ
ncbi:MAG TPA: chitinase, partial [Legionella sp.]|nr:chitinase [Legionella sp.]